MPAMIKSISDTAQNTIIKIILFLANPWRRTKLFCAPMARIREKPSRKPLANGEANTFTYVSSMIATARIGLPVPPLIFRGKPAN